MTEKQGGSDLRANTTRAEPVGTGGPGGEFEESIMPRLYREAPLNSIWERSGT
jgi:hypothetical protein